MMDDFQETGVAFVDFPATPFSSGSSAATIATYPRPSSFGRARRTTTAPHHDVPLLIGESPEIVEIVAYLRRIAPSQATVMLVGESGTGKEVAAQLVHAHSTRANAPFVAVNCGAIPASLVEAELFGYERGAFTGAERQHQGYFERASGGTLFLDEITEMPLELQTKLLRVLETGRMIRVGGTEEVALDVRIVTASNRTPEAVLRDHRLREDLFYRLAVFVVRLPPLRQRGRDIELLAKSFLERLNREHGTRKQFDPEALATAVTHPWPGNVRELKNCVERSFVLCDEVIVLDLQPVRHFHDEGDDARDCVRVPIGMTMADAERELLLATLTHCGGNKRRTAEMLGLSVKTVYNKLVGQGVQTPSILQLAGD